MSLEGLDSGAIHSYDTIPHRGHHHSDLLWSPGKHRLSVVVDCKALADILSGHAGLSDNFFRPMFVRMARIIAKLFGAGWHPRRDTCSYIEWRPRRYNVVADYLCNAAMDQQCARGWFDKGKFEHAVCAGSHLHLYSDGGLRKGHCGSTGWVLYSVHACGNEWLLTMLAWRTLFLEDATLRSSFQCESLALEDALQFLSEQLPMIP